MTLQPTYSVLASDPTYRAIVGDLATMPTADTSALLREWDRMGFKYLSLQAATRIGAAVCVLKDPLDATTVGVVEGGQ